MFLGFRCAWLVHINKPQSNVHSRGFRGLLILYNGIVSIPLKNVCTSKYKALLENRFSTLYVAYMTSGIWFQTLLRLKPVLATFVFQERAIFFHQMEVWLFILVLILHLCRFRTSLLLLLPLRFRNEFPPQQILLSSISIEGRYEPQI